jgi:hypothetical protein
MGNMSMPFILTIEVRFGNTMAQQGSAVQKGHLILPVCEHHFESGVRISEVVSFDLKFASVMVHMALVRQNTQDFGEGSECVRSSPTCGPVTVITVVENIKPIIMTSKKLASSS